MAAEIKLWLTLCIVMLACVSCGTKSQNDTGGSSRTSNGNDGQYSSELSSGNTTGSNSQGVSNTHITNGPAFGIPVEAVPTELPGKERTAKIAGTRFYVGCWTVADGNALQVTEQTVQTRGSGRPLRYKDLTDESSVAMNLRVLEIVDKDASGQLSKYISLEPLEGDEVQSRGFDSLDELKTNHPKSVYARWAKESCDRVLPMLKGK